MSRLGRCNALAMAVLGVLGVVVAGAASRPEAPKTTEFGRGPAIVMIHELGGNRMGWMPTARRLLGTHRVVLVDVPGHDQSALPDPFSVEACVEAIDQVLAKERPDSTIVVGHGLGGVLALMAAAARPGRVKGVAVIDAGLRLAQPIPDQRQKAFLRFMDERYDDFLRGLFLRAGRDSAQGVILHAQAAQVPAATVKAYMRASLNMDASRALKDVKEPLLYIGTEKNWAADMDWPALAKRMGYPEGVSLQTRRITGCGPLIATEQPDSLAAVLAEFAARAIAAKN